MTLDGTPDRDIIFKELRSRAQMQQQMSQNALPAAMIPPLIPNIVPATQINSDEIFREMQHRALQMQIEQDRLESEQRAERNKLDAEIPVLMIADTFPRRPIEPITERTSEENAAEITTTTTTTITTKTTTTATAAANSELITKVDNSGSSSESLSAFLNIFNKGIQGSEITNSPNKEQKITIKNDDIKVESEVS
ncbi:unnamed protein product [Brugia pahangi]|uniref:Uncharacterized protein n=1 Tax=Brugia pahangi TaxID=6280 RepID=A0A0N4TFA2_BRUPA|nr:unnamed protein product [Brugia pahangi]